MRTKYRIVEHKNEFELYYTVEFRFLFLWHDGGVRLKSLSEATQLKESMERQNLPTHRRVIK